MERTPKTCVVCGRTITWRKKWARDWENVRYCSDRCRGRRLDDTDRALEDAILGLLARRAASSSICPSEAAREVAPEDWRELMERAREAARRLVEREQVAITQRGRRVDPSRAAGPIRIVRGDRYGISE